MDNDMNWAIMGNIGLQWLLEKYSQETIDVLFLGQGDFAKEEAEIAKTYRRVNIIVEDIKRK